ncbi:MULTISPECIES: MFS transporter [unclassified Sinorhizobium]|uniref:MFS transporter n=1 Tax=unclassified Sinorhizobium TaxID=2613772 RepID=UPI00352451D9
MTERRGDPAYRGLSGTDILLFAMACGLSVANIYLAQPLLDAMARDLGVRPAMIGTVVTATQLGYALGLIFLVPLGDLVDRRRLIVLQTILSSLALLAAATSSDFIILLAALCLVGLLAVAVQVLVAFAAALVVERERGKTVGVVTSGVVIGILLARFVSGVLADIAGWRSVYLASAALMLITTAILARRLPTETAKRARTSYPHLLRSAVMLLAEEPLFRTRAILALLIFATFSTFWTAMVLPLTAPPLSLSHAGIGLFGIVGLAGALAAGAAGRLADRGLAQWTTGISLALMLFSWLPIALLSHSLWPFVFGVLILDFAIQAVHVTNQSVILALRPDAQSRLIGSYMVFYSAGSAFGAIASTIAYGWAGWTGVSVLGACISATALLFWLVTRRPITAASRKRAPSTSRL